MGDEEKIFSEIVAAAKAGNDILFGESHDMVSVTVKTIIDVIDHIPPDSIQGIVLELPVSMAEIFDPVVVNELGFEGFVRRGIEIEIEDAQKVAIEMFSAGEISEAQFLYVQDWLRDYADTPISKLITSSHFPHFFDLAKSAADKGVKIFPADQDRKRAVAGILSHIGAPHQIKMDWESASRIICSGLDDTSDLDHVMREGFNPLDPRILIVHRGYKHLDNSALCAGRVTPVGFDDLLEERGRKNKTISVISDNYIRYLDFSLDPLDLSLREPGSSRVNNTNPSP